MSESESDESGSSRSNWPQRRVLQMSSEGDSSSESEVDVDTAPPKSAPAKDIVSSYQAILKGTNRSRNPPILDMIVEAIHMLDTGVKGASVPAIKARMRTNHEISEISMKTHFKRQIEKGINKGILTRPPKYKDNAGLTGRFKVNPEYLKSQKKAAMRKDSKVKAVKDNEKSAKASAPRKAKEKPSHPINKKNLKSLKESTAVAKAAKLKIKEARRSVGLSQSKKSKVVVQKQKGAKSAKAAEEGSSATTQKSRSKKDGKKAATKSPKSKAATGTSSKSVKPQPKPRKRNAKKA